MPPGRDVSPSALTAASGELTAALRRFIEGISGPVLLVRDRFVEVPDPLPGEVTHSVDGMHVTPGRWAAVVAVAADVAALRTLATLLPPLGKARTVAVVLAEADRPVLLLPREEWPPITGLAARTPGSGAITTVRFSRPAPATLVLQQLARQAVPGRTPAHGLQVGRLPDWPGMPPPADAGLALLDADDPMPPDTVVPSDVVLAVGSRALPVSEVTGRAPVVLSGPMVGPIDERVLNPRGFVQRDTVGMGGLVTDDAGGVRVTGEGVDVWFAPGRGATAAGVRALRGLRGVRVDWPQSRAIQPCAALTVAGLAAAGVPLVGDAPGDDTGLDEQVRAAIAGPVDLLDDLRREEHSIRLRRAAILAHGTAGWRSALAEAAGLVEAQPTISVVLATRRPHQLRFALRQFTRQRGVVAELVLVAHGFVPDEATVRELVGDRPHTVVCAPAETLFGEALNLGVAAASGDLVMKMDDDDWYSPDFLLDLLVARKHSAAELVGTTSEYVYLEQVDRTLRRSDESERNARFVAGGTMLLSRADLREVGGFRAARRFVDASLLQSLLAAGGAVYRAQGLGYVLRRTGSGHTWEPGLDFFLDPERMGEQWSGFVPSQLLQADPVDLPATVGGPQ